MGRLVGAGRFQASQPESEPQQQDAEHEGLRSYPDHKSQRSGGGEEYQQHPEGDGQDSTQRQEPFTGDDLRQPDGGGDLK